MENHYEITPRTVLLGLALFVSIWLVFQLSTVLASLFIALILSLTLNPLVVRLELWRVPRAVGVFLVFFGTILILGSLLVYGFSPLVNQTGKFILKLPEFLAPVLAQLGPISFAGELQRQLATQATSISANILSITAGLVSNLFFVLTTFVFTFYFLLDWANLKNRFVGMLNSKARGRVLVLIEAVEKRLGGWLRGQIALMLVMGILVYLGLFALGVEFALPLAVIAGLLEIVPVIGIIVSAIPALIVGFGTSFWLGVWILVLYEVSRQLENTLIVPHVMGRAAGFSPLSTLIFLFVGGQLFGMVGVLLSIPAAIIISIFAKDMRHWTSNK